MRILEDDFKCGQYWLEYSSVNSDDFVSFNNELIKSFFLFTKDFMTPYSINISFSTFDSYWFLDEFLVEYHLSLDKPQIKKTICTVNTIEKTVSEISAQEIEKLLLNIRQQSNVNSLIGISKIACYAGLYYLPKKTKETTFTLYTGSGSANHTNSSQPIFKGIGIEAPLNPFRLWTPIEIIFKECNSNLDLSLILNWDLYSKQNKQGFLMLKKALGSLVENGWENNMPKNIFG